MSSRSVSAATLLGLAMTHDACVHRTPVDDVDSGASGCGGTTPSGATTDTATTGEPPCEGKNILSEPTWTLLGTEDEADGFGEIMAVGDVDEDGLGDILAIGYSASAAYLVLGSTLVRSGPGTWDVTDVADYVLDLTWEEGEYTHFYAGAYVRPGELYIGNPVPGDGSRPLAYRITWDALVAAGPGTHDPAEVAESLLYGTSWYMGQSIQVCDVNGDEERDLLLEYDFIGDFSYPGYLVLGPMGSGSISLDTEAVLLYYASHPYRGACKLGACADYNGDGIDDFALACREPVTEESVVNIYYGGASMGDGGVVDLGTADVVIWFEYDAEVADAFYVFAAPESVADYNGDGNSDLIVNSYAFHYPEGSDIYSDSELSLFLGGAGFHPSGTVLTQADRHFSAHRGSDAESDPTLGRGASIAGDVNCDGSLDLVIGDAAYEWTANGGGGVHLRTSPVAGGDHEIGEVAEFTYVGYSDENSISEQLGTNVFASQDFDGDGRVDIVAAAPHYAPNVSGINPRLGAIYVFTE